MMVDKIERTESTALQGAPKQPDDFSLAHAKLSDLPAPPRAAADDLKIVDDSTKPPTRQEQRQEFVDGFGRVGKLYSDSVHDDARLGTFQKRMGDIYDSDHKTFKDLAALTDKLAAKPPATSEEVGVSLGKTYADALSRQNQKGPIDLSSAENKTLQGALSGYMLAARATFAPGSEQQQTEKMVDAFESQLRQSKVPYVHAIIWGDTKEPGMATYPPNQTYDRHNFLPPN